MNRDPHAWARLGQAIQQTRLAQRLSQSQLAERAEVSLASVQNAEAGKPPRGRMPYTLPPIVAALGWPAGSIDTILDGGDPPSGWGDVPARPHLDPDLVESVITNAMVRATHGTTSTEIREAVKIAVDALRDAGVLYETDGAQP
jgi:transcriptional regulator with XRE-family HTH domain